MQRHDLKTETILAVIQMPNTQSLLLFPACILVHIHCCPSQTNLTNEQKQNIVLLKSQSSCSATVCLEHVIAEGGTSRCKDPNPAQWSTMGGTVEGGDYDKHVASHWTL